MPPVDQEGKQVREYACVDGPEIEAHAIGWNRDLYFGRNRAQRLRLAAAIMTCRDFKRDDRKQTGERREYAPA
jgi:hypothetical protein